MKLLNQTNLFAEGKITPTEELKAPKIKIRLPKIKTHNLPELNLQFVENNQGLVA